MPNECDSNQISHVAVKPPPFWKHNLVLWFVRLEGQFELAKILIDTTIIYVLSSVESEILNSVSDLVRKPPENGNEKVCYSMLFSFGKLEWRSSPGLISDRLIYRVLLADSSSKITFLIDTGADISFIPKSFTPHAKVQEDLTLYAANGTKILTYGTTRILLELGLRRQFTWSFVIADLKPLRIRNALQIFCDVSRENVRPYVPEELPFEVFRSLHNLSHPGIRATKRLIQDRFVWPSMLKDITKWTRCCIPCQRSNVQRHTMQPFAPTVERFQHVHIDLVGPFPPSDDFIFLLTCIDRFTRWPEVIPVSDISAEAVVKSFIANWISHFGVPAIITTDQGGQFSLVFSTA
ncbi:retrovirus-related Pol polyprotein from transposon 412 [Trichonephila clavipes]|nr:retrovirus-related Pol polyprotein from transposon 412 [Trichonephila clavipes]